jgi:two-component system, LytTR family, sensor kinase
MRTALSLAAWAVAWWLVQVVVLHRLGLDWQLAAADAGVFSGLNAVSAAAAMLLYRYYQPSGSSRFMRLIFAVVITLATCWLFEEIMRSIYGSDPAYLTFLEFSMPVRFVIAVLVIACVSLVNWMMNLLDEQKTAVMRRNESEALLREAELMKLRQQLQPHFLFNSLNSISALAGSDAGRARAMIQQLSDFLRGTLKKDEQSEVTLEEELRQLNLYLEIEKVRFSHRLNTALNVDESCMKLKLPSLLLQPLVENAIKHGLYGTTGGITITVSAWCESELLHLSVSNPFEPGMVAGAGTGFGLSSLQRRLFLLYARNDLLQVTRDNNIFTAHLVVPQRIYENR